MVKPIYLVLLAATLAACGILSLGGTNADGTPKTGADARQFLRSGIDASVQVWGTEALRRENPQLLVMLDANENGVLELAEIEAVINVESPEALTQSLVLAILLFKNKPQ